MLDWITRLLLIPLKPLLTKQLGSVLRTLLATLAGFLVSKGVTNHEQADIFIGVNFDVLMGVLTYVVAQTSSWIEKQKREK
jgi:hypothetical protein